MSQYPPPDLNYASGAYQPSPRPTSVSVMAILAIIFGALGLICGGTGLITQLVVLAMGGKNPLAPSMPVMTNHGVLAFNVISGLVYLVLSLALLLGGIGALKLSPWARQLLIRWSVVVIVWATIVLVLQLAWLNPVTAEFNRQVQAKVNPKAAPAISAFVGPMQTAASIFGWLLMCVLPVLFLTLWRSPKVVAAFGPAATARLYPPTPPFPPVA